MSVYVHDRSCLVGLSISLSKILYKSCPDRPPGANTLPLSDELGQIPATEALECRWVPIRRLRKTSVIVVGHTYRVIYITSPSQNLKNLEICPDRPPGSNTLPLGDEMGQIPATEALGCRWAPIRRLLVGTLELEGAHSMVMEDTCCIVWLYLLTECISTIFTNIYYKF